MSELYDILVETPPTKVILLALDQGLWDCERSLAELAKLIHKTGDKMWIMWTTRKSNIYFVQLVWFTIKLAGWQKKKRFTWIGREAAFYSRFLCSCMEGLVLWLGFSGYGRFGLSQPGACAA